MVTVTDRISTEHGQLNDDDTESIQNKRRNMEMISKLQTFYIEYLAENVEMYGSTFFNVKVLEPEMREYTVSLMMQIGVNLKFVYFCNEQNRVIHKFGIHRIRNLICSVPDNEMSFEIESDREDDPSTRYRLWAEKIEQISIVLSNYILECRREQKL